MACVGYRGLAHPAFTGAVALLAVNDHLLKPAVGSWWTGKVSDVAGVFAATVALAAITGRARTSGLAVGAAFAVVKTVPAVAAGVAPLLGGVTRTDATDLVALLAIVPAVVLVERHDAQRRRAPAGRGLAVVSGAVAVLVTTATSCSPLLAVDAFVVPGDGSVAARIRDESAEVQGHAESEITWAVSDDGGATWRRSEHAPEGRPSDADQACSASLGCFRTRHLTVEQRDGDSGPWRTSFAFSAEQRRRIRQRDDPCAIGDDLTAVAIVERPDGDHVVVSMENQGVLHRPPDGQWERRGVLDLDPVSTSGPSWLIQLLWVGPLVAMALACVVLWGTRRRYDRSGRRQGLLTAIAGGVGLIVFAGLLGVTAMDYAIAGPAIAGLSVGLFLESLHLARHPRRASPLPTPRPLSGLW